jgi:hypothetical protein
MKCSTVKASFIISIPNIFLALVSAILKLVLFLQSERDCVSKPYETIYKMTAYIPSNPVGFHIKYK